MAPTAACRRHTHMPAVSFPPATRRERRGGSREPFYHTRGHLGRGRSQNETVYHFERARLNAWPWRGIDQCCGLPKSDSSIIRYSQCCGAMSIHTLQQNLCRAMCSYFTVCQRCTSSALWNRGHKLCQPGRAIACAHKAEEDQTVYSLRPTRPRHSLILRDSLDQALDRTQPSSVFTLAMPHAPSSRADFLVHNLHRDHHAAKLSHVLQQDSSFHLMTGTSASVSYAIRS